MLGCLAGDEEVMVCVKGCICEDEEASPSLRLTWIGEEESAIMLAGE